MQNVLLKVEQLNAWYDHSHIVQGLNFEVKQGEIVTLMGLVSKHSGKATFDGQDLMPLATHERFHLGLAYVPEDRRIVPSLTVLENLQLGLTASKNRGDMNVMIDEIAQTFPRLKERLHQDGTSMSGGEQQMLAIARAMMARPRMILLDEPSEGIMPILVDEMFELFVSMRQKGVTILLVEQNVERALKISDRAYIVDQGQIVHHGSAAELLANTEIQEKYCAV